MGVWIGQYKAYLGIQERLIQGDEDTCALVADIPFDVSKTNKMNLSWLPYIVHTLLAVVMWLSLDSFWIGAGYFLGIMSHPVQGWMVNALAHKYGGRNFETDDDSTNNLFVGLFVFGEGYQNNHHKFPKRAKFSVRWFEFDPGYAMCLVAEALGLLKVVRVSNKD
jgi:stearoyl-CoA desaturase (delta-9 desaturase)